MKKIALFFLLLATTMNLFPQDNTVLKFIHVPHPRSEEKVNQSVLPGIEHIDFTKYDMIMLGGDLTWYTSHDRKTMSYCDSLFDLDSPNTLWSLGNHDTENRELIKEYTGKESYYAYYRDGITFLVIDVELDANGFTSSFISGDQLQMIKNVCDTISVSNHLILVHGRLLWMIGNDDLTPKLDSVAESTKQLDTTNFYQEVYPQLQKAKSRGVKVMCLGGDKSKINIIYSPEDSITFYATIMAPEFTDNVNNVLILNYNLQNKVITTNYITLADIDKTNGIIVPQSAGVNSLNIWPTAGSNEMNMQLPNGTNEPALIRIYFINGMLWQSFNLKSNEIKQVHVNQTGMYIAKAISSNTTYSVKFICH